MQDLKARPEPFTPIQLEGAKELRKRLESILPPTYDTDFFLARWFRAYKGDLEAVELKLKELIAHRQTLGYNEANVLECCSTFEFAKKTFERFSISQLKIDVFSEDVAVFLQKMRGVDIKEIVKVIPLSYVLHSYLLLQECFHTAIYKHEQRTGRPSAVVVVIDLDGLSLTDFMNPLSAPSKLARLVVKLWSDYFSENLIRLYLLHPPGLLSLMWQVAKHIVDAKTQSSVVFLAKTEEILQFLDAKAVPKEVGGERVDTSGFAQPPEACVSAPKPVLSTDHFCIKKNFWEKHGVVGKEVPESKHTSLKSKAIHEISQECEAGQQLLWTFTTSSDLSFEIVHIQENQKQETSVWPKITLTSLKTPEHGVVDCKKAGIYCLRFGNASGSWLAAKLQYAVLVK
uniref:CRAL-TRIO domain-containing protein n=1 Tax=Ditylenchus dipsaci TaxID=166011 RepID=A0A915DI27_9BILA